MRSFILPLWLAAFLSFVLPALACKQKWFIYQKEYQNCNEGVRPEVHYRTVDECLTFHNAFLELSAQTQNQFGRDITSEMQSAAAPLPPNNPNCIYYRCRVISWRYREWQTNMDNRPLPAFPGWTLVDSFYRPGTNKCD
ncbi:hypothetical protein BS50DRAFT_530973 [Corynespora cassiicola Philippines]|uniref:Avirulence Effector AvrLm4-7 domain-containing protein n=1 Tax=Corynespora cassiicola Philippines TaxID=1448308 RepID=A0A2T2NCS5_CORCC|nr:hypothetical protein BS50DRAFT_530973 [Corynespora cassiicola Philippines]